MCHPAPAPPPFETRKYASGGGEVNQKNFTVLKSYTIQKIRTDVNWGGRWWLNDERATRVRPGPRQKPGIFGQPRPRFWLYIAGVDKKCRNSKTKQLLLR